VVPDLGRVVEDAAFGSFDQVLERGILLRRPGSHLVEVVDIGFVVLAVVVFESLGGQKGFEIVGAER